MKHFIKYDTRIFKRCSRCNEIVAWTNYYTPNGYICCNHCWTNLLWRENGGFRLPKYGKDLLKLESKIKIKYFKKRRFKKNEPNGKIR